jgi:hypothetical protein
MGGVYEVHRWDGLRCHYIVTYPGFAWLIRQVLDLTAEFIGPLYNWLQQFTNHYVTHCYLLPTGHSTGTIPTLDCTPLYSFNSDLSYKVKVTLRLTVSQSVLVSSLIWGSWPDIYYSSQLPPTVPSFNSSARTPWKTPSSVVKNECLLVRYLAMVVLLLRTYASGMCLPSCCLAMGICVTLYVPGFIKIGSGIESWQGEIHRQHGDFISLLLFLKIREVG